MTRPTIKADKMPSRAHGPTTIMDGPSLFAPILFLGRLMAAALLALALLAMAAQVTPARDLAVEADLWPELLVEVGHGDFELVPTIERYGLVVTELGPLDENGDLYSFSFSVAMSSFGTTVVANNGLRSWRISFVSGELLAQVFQVRSNTADELSVTSAFGPLNGLAVGDLLFVEQVPVRQPIQPMRDEQGPFIPNEHTDLWLAQGSAVTPKNLEEL